VTTKGVKVATKLTEWQYLNRYWFTNRFDNELMIIDTILLPGRMEFVINPEIKERLKKEVSAYIPYEEVPPTALDKMTTWFATKLPGNK
jgi:GTP cyclohydrolase III